jgi:hypothetical protein
MSQPQTGSENISNFGNEKRLEDAILNAILIGGPENTAFRFSLSKFRISAASYTGNSRRATVTHVLGTNCYLCLRVGQ